MHNLEQIRAKNACEAADSLEKKIVKKIPAYIIQNGLLGTLAFVIDKKEYGYKNALLECLKHCQCREVHCSTTVGNELVDWSKELANMETGKLQRVTSETLAFLNYLRRYAKDSKEDEHRE